MSTQVLSSKIRVICTRKVYLRCCCNLQGVRNCNGLESRDSDTSDEDVIRIPITYSGHNAISGGRMLGQSTSNGIGQQNRIATFVSENVTRDFHDYENWTPRVLSSSARDRAKEVRFKLPQEEK